MTIVLSLALAGGAIDFGRWLSAKSKTINAIDASILAGGRVLQLSGKTNADAVTAASLYYSKNKTDTLTTDNTSFSVNNNEITGTSTSTIETPFLKVIGINSLPVNVTAKAVLSAGSNSGSHIEVSMMLDTTGSMWGTKMVDLKQAAIDLVDIVVWEDQSTFTAKVALAPFSEYVNVSKDHFTDITNYNTQGNSDNRTCVKERSGTNRYTDVPPSATNGFFGRYTGRSACRPQAVILPLTNDVKALKNRINEMQPTGLTAGHLGTAWAWYLLSPNWSDIWPADSEPLSYSLTSQLNSSGQPMLHKMAILMTDGSYNRSYSGSNSTTQARELCDQMKAKGITIYTVGFRIGVGSTPDVTMQLCATSSSHYYNASSGEALKQAFRDIAIKISELRISE